MFRLFRGLYPAAGTPKASVPRGVRVYAVGDIHGRLDLVNGLLEKIAQDAERAPDFQNYLVFLGDYVDRGLASRQVIDLMIAPPPAGFGTIHLRGNHEQAMLDFLSDAHKGAAWLRFGGQETLISYGVGVPAEPLGEQLEQARIDLQRRLPTAHLSFLRHTRLSIAIGDYFFAHAGVRPGVALKDQSPEDLLWIRNEFLDSRADFGKVVVHGHTIVDAPQVRPNRIGIDTGAFATGHLTCLVLEGDQRRFIQT